MLLNTRIPDRPTRAQESFLKVSHFEPAIRLKFGMIFPPQTAISIHELPDSHGDGNVGAQVTAKNEERRA